MFARPSKIGWKSDTALVNASSAAWTLRSGTVRAIAEYPFLLVLSARVSCSGSE